MKAFTRYVYGGPDVLQLEDVAKPTPGANQILVKVKANSVNPADWHILRGKPFFSRLTYGLLKPKYKVPGSDFAGIVEAIGENVTDFRVGDRVFGSTLVGGAFAEYISVPENNCAHMPGEASFSEMASLPIAGVTAYEALIKYGKLQGGETVLINGATGGVGHFAIQIAKAHGARVTAVCSKASIAFAKALGADEVVPYDQKNIHQHKGLYDLVIDAHGNLSYKDYRRLGKRGVVVGFTTMGRMMRLLLRKSMGQFSIGSFTVNLNKANFETLGSLVRDQKIKTHIQKSFSHEQIPSAIAYIEAMHTKGKVAIKWT